MMICSVALAGLNSLWLVFQGQRASRLPLATIYHRSARLRARIQREIECTYSSDVAILSIFA
jgi:hypothetical protein